MEASHTNDAMAKAAYEFGVNCQNHLHWQSIDCEDKIVFFGTRPYTLDIVTPWIDRFDGYYQTEYGFGGVILDYTRKLAHAEIAKEFFNIYLAFQSHSSL